MSNSQRIAELNDQCRTTLAVDQKLVQTRGIASLPADLQVEILQKVKTFDDFNEENDPHKEHDFGSFELEGHMIFWKIDYYDRSLTNGSEDPADPEQTVRVLTIMLSEEY